MRALIRRANFFMGETGIYSFLTLKRGKLKK